MYKKLWNKKYIYLILVNILTCFSFYMITTILTTYLVGIGTNIHWAGVVVGLFSITSLIIRPFTGYISDKYNKKSLLITGSFLVSISIAGYVGTHYLPVITAFRILHGIAFGLNSTAIVALASEFIPEEKFNEGIGYLGLGQIVASAVGPGFGVWIMNTHGIINSFLAASVFSAAGMLFMLLFGYKYQGKKAGIKKGIHIHDIISVKVLDYTFIGGIYSFMNGVIASFLVLFALEKGIADVSIYFTVCAVFLFLARPLAGKLVDRTGLKYVVYPGIIMSVLSLLLLANADSMVLIIISAVIRSVAQGAVQPSIQAACIKRAGIGKSGVATSTYYLGGDIGQGLGPIIGGFVVGALGYKGIYYICIILMVLAAVMFYYSEKREENKNEE